MITQRPWPLAFNSSIIEVVSSIVSPVLPDSLAVARIDRSELHWTTSILIGPSPKICMTSVPSNLRFADSNAHAAIISPRIVRTGAG